jgi:membrane fusion protein (multidrug efflux system)
MIMKQQSAIVPGRSQRIVAVAAVLPEETDHDPYESEVTSIDANLAADESMTKLQPTVAGKSSATPRPPPPVVTKRRRRLAMLISAAVLVLVAGGIVYYVHFIAPFESTDDAFIEGHVTIISPRVSGPVVHLLVRDNQEVKKGDELLDVDPGDYETKMAQARADLDAAHTQVEQAKTQTTVDKAKAAQEQAAVVAAEAEARRAETDLKRYQSVETRSVSRSQLDLAQAQAESNAAGLEVAHERAKAAAAQVNLSRVIAETALAGVKQAEAKLKQAELDLSYTRVIAPIAGHVTRRTVEEGAYVMTGQSLLSLVPANVWVVANFKETQLAHIRPGQSVRITMDAYPGQEFKGKVESLQSGTGAQFSLLPPENAVGNYVKVVQRVPVKILFDEPLPSQLDVSPGMSVTPKVRVK